MSMTDAQKLKAIKDILNNQPINYGGYIENGLDIANDTIKAIEEILK